MKKKKLNKIIEYLKEGKILSLISDAGTPTLSDPGLLLINTCIKKKIDIFPVPGTSSITASMSISGFDDKFIFYGFLPKTENQLEKVLSKLKNLDFSIIFFIPAVKINFYLEKFKTYFSGRDLLLCKEITKMHETFYRSSVDSFKKFNSTVKGEFTVVISKNYNKNKISTDLEIKKQAVIYLRKYSLKDTVSLISKKENISKKKVYDVCLDIKKNEKNN